MAKPPELLDPKRRRTLHWFQLDVREALNDPALLDLNLAQRGLLFSMMIFYWWRGPLARDANKLARTLQLKKSDVARNLPAVLETGHFAPYGETELFSPDLEQQAVVKEAEVAKKRAAGRATAQRRSDALGQRDAHSEQGGPDIPF
jgi:hypothetical protein